MLSRQKRSSMLFRKMTAALLALILTTSVCAAAVGFDAKPTSDTLLDPPGSTTLTVTNMTVGASATALVVFVNIGNQSGGLPSVSGATWNGTAAPLIGSKS